MSTNCMFPYIVYDKSKTPLKWGEAHGEGYRSAIQELSEIRRELMLKKNPKLKKKLDQLALEQFVVSEKFAPHIAQELVGIQKGANLSLSDIVILNNYTDFRDLQLPEEGCSTIHLQRNDEVLSGQTWDMHRSAKNYMCLLHVPETNLHSSQLILTLVGCVGLMGVTPHGTFIGVNNINTQNARVGLIWPLLVRRVLEEKNLSGMKNVLLNAPVTSGHNYLISSQSDGGEHLEVTPTISESVGKLAGNENGHIFHTNHCLGAEIQKIEDKTSMSSTTFNRYDLLTEKSEKVNSLADLETLLTDHTEYPKSICSHFENGAQDPSFTCGGGVSDLKKGLHSFWRGCPIHDNDYIKHTFKISNNDFIKT